MKEKIPSLNFHIPSVATVIYQILETKRNKFHMFGRNEESDIFISFHFENISSDIFLCTFFVLL